MEIKEKLSRLLELANKTAVAKKAGVNVMTLHFLLTGRTEPKISTIKALACALDVDAGWLLDDGRGFPAERIKKSETATAA